jgi:parvulin-like peptidyl-prolyl isomerase
MLRTLVFLPLLTLTLAAQTPAPVPAAPVPATPKSATKPVAAKTAAPAKPEVHKDTVLARINGKPVMESEFLIFLDMAYNPQQRMQIGMVDGAMQQVQDQYLQTRLFEAKARKDGLDKGPAFARKRAMLETDILVRALFERDGAKLQEKIKVSDADIKAFYDKNPDKFKSPETFTARHILLSSKESPAPDAKTLSDEELKAKVAKVQDALKGGKKLEDLTKDFSDDPGSKEKGGLYENISFGSFVPEFEAAVRAQKVGEVGEPVKSQYGYHLIQVEKVTPSELQPFEAAKEKAQQLATQARQEQVMKDFLESVKKEIPFAVGPGTEKASAPKTQPPATGSN